MPSNLREPTSLECWSHICFARVPVASCRLEATRCELTNSWPSGDLCSAKQICLGCNGGGSVNEYLGGCQAIAHHVNHDGEIEVPFAGLREQAKTGRQALTVTLGLPSRSLCENEEGLMKTVAVLVAIGVARVMGRGGRRRSVRRGGCKAHLARTRQAEC